MTKIAYIMLCHANPIGLHEQITTLTKAGDYVSIHFDKNSSFTDYTTLTSLLENNANVVFSPRIKCGWGEWSLVQATLAAMNLTLNTFKDATHFYLISGDCLPIKSAKHIKSELKLAALDYIEHYDFWTSGWIKTGIVEDRLYYRHFLNERKFPRLFYWLLATQKKLGLKRKLPKGLKEIKIGSQWFCLRRSTCEKILEFLNKRKDVITFFKTVWVPDECFFQTLVHKLIPSHEIKNASPTFLLFSDYGKPITFYSDYKDFLFRQNNFFARKVSSNALEFRKNLLELYGSKKIQKNPKNNGKNIIANLISAGRRGLRFSDRIWDRTSKISNEKIIYFVIGYNHELIKKVIEEISESTEITKLGFIFENTLDEIPDLGGIETSLDKRTRHRRAFIHTLFNAIKKERILICATPAIKYILDDFSFDSCQTRYLAIQSDQKSEIIEKYEDLHHFGYDNYYHLSMSQPLEYKVKQLANFMEVTDQIAQGIFEKIEKE